MSFFFADPVNAPIEPENVSPFKPTGLKDNFDAALSEFEAADTSTSKLRMLRKARDERRKSVEDVTGESFNDAVRPFMISGLDPDHPFMQNDVNQRHVDAAIEKFRETLPKDQAAKILSSRMLEARAEEIAIDQVARARDVQARGEGAGAAVGAFLGTAGGALKDPIVQATLGAGAYNAARLTTMAAVEAAIAGAVEVPIQFKVQAWRKRLGLEHGPGVALKNIGAAAAGAGAVTLGLGGAVRVGGALVRLSNRDTVRAFDDVVPNPTPEQKAARDALDREAEHDARNPLGDTPQGHEEHARRTAEAEAAVDAFELPTADAGPLADAPIETFVPNPPRPTKASTSGALYQFRPEEIEVDARAFQFKAGGDNAGVTDRLKGVKQWDPARAGIAIVYEDGSGKRFIADGHQRRGLAARIAAEDPAQDPRLNAFLYREADGYSIEDIRVIAALKNIAEGSGSPVDAAKILRARGSIEANLPPNSTLVRDAGGIARLSDDAFGMVINELVPANHAAILGRLAPDLPDVHAQALEVLARTKPANAIEAESILRDVLSAPTVRETQVDLFGPGTTEQILFAERAKVLSNAAKRLKDDKRAFSLLVREEGRITDAGNELATDVNKARAEDDARILETLQKLARRKGPVADALAKAAREFKDGGKLADVTGRFVDDVRRTADGEPDAGSGSGSGRPDGESRVGRDTGDTGDLTPGARTSTEDPDFFSEPAPSPILARAPDAVRDFASDAKAGQTAQADGLEADLRQTIETGGDFDVPVSVIEDAAGETSAATMKASELLDELDGDRDFVEQLGLCLK